MKRESKTATSATPSLRDRIAAAVLAALEGQNLCTERVFPDRDSPEYASEPYGSIRILDNPEIAERVAPLAADAVIAELQPELNRHDTGCVCNECWFNHYGKADDE